MNRVNPPLQVVGFVGTKRGDQDRGPAVWMRGDDAAVRGVADGELVWIYGPRRHELARMSIDDSIPRGGIVVRDIAGLRVSEVVRLVRPDEDRPVLHQRPRS